MRTFMNVLLAYLLGSGLAAGEILFDFETGVEGWITTSRTATIGTTGEYTSSGARAIEFRHGVWQVGEAEWPAFETSRLGVTDWSAYDRLVLEVVNPTSDSLFFGLLLADETQEMNRGVSMFYGQISAYSHKQVVCQLSKLPELTQRKGIHFFTERPPKEFRLIVDRIVLLKRGEALPAIPDSIIQKLDHQRNAKLTAGEALWDHSLQAFLAQYGQSTQACAAAEMLNAKLIDFRERILRYPYGSVEYAYALSQITQSGEYFNRLSSIFAGAEKPPYVKCFCSSERIFPYYGSLPSELPSPVSLSGARGEREGFQIAVVNGAEWLAGVSVVAGTFLNENGVELNVEPDIFPIGLIDCRTESPNGTVMLGHFPEPLLEHVDSVNVKPFDTQSFYVAFKIPRDAVSGSYQGQVTLSGDGYPLRTVDVMLRVYDFTIPATSMLPLMISTWFPKCGKVGAGYESANEDAYCDLLTRYLVNYDMIYYDRRPARWEQLERMHLRGELERFTLEYVFQDRRSDENLVDYCQREVERIRPAYEEAKRRGLLPYARLYGFDECNSDRYGLLDEMGRRLKAAFPGVPFLSTARDRGQTVKSVDGWIPLTTDYSLAQADALREAGKEMWWYVCMEPGGDFANFQLENEPIEARSLMGFQAAKMRVDGFLYYETTMWGENTPLALMDGTAYTDWNPRSYQMWNLDGSLLYRGPGNQPFGSLRLENIRDGLEDYAYHAILERNMEQLTAKESLTPTESQWLSEAAAVFQIPDAVVKTASCFSRSPAVIQAYRDVLAELNERFSALN